MPDHVPVRSKIVKRIASSIQKCYISATTSVGAEEQIPCAANQQECMDDSFPKAQTYGQIVVFVVKQETLSPRSGQASLRQHVISSTEILSFF